MKTEHAGAKNGGGHWGTRADAKVLSNSLRRINDRIEANKRDDYEPVYFQPTGAGVVPVYRKDIRKGQCQVHGLYFTTKDGCPYCFTDPICPSCGKVAREGEMH